jgi:very-short-patch-repair endonuclease
MNMMLFIILGLAALAMAVAAALKGRLGESPADDRKGSISFRLETKPYFFSVADNKFYTALIASAESLDLAVFPKVGLNDIFKDAKDAEKSQYNRYAQMHIDYLLVTRHDFKPVAGIELDGSSHQGKKQQERDQKKTAVFKAAKLPLLRFYNQDQYQEADIRSKLEDLLGTHTGTQAKRARKTTARSR